MLWIEEEPETVAWNPYARQMDYMSPQAQGLTRFFPLNEGTAYDFSVNNKNGIANNTQLIPNAINGKCLSFNGTNSYIETYYVLPSTNFSFGGFFETNGNFGSNNRLMGNADATTGLNGISVLIGYTGSNKIYTVIRGGSGHDIGSTATNLSAGVHHYFVTMSSVSGTKIFYDGRIIDIDASVLNMATVYPFRIGRDGNGVTAFSGKIWDVKIFNRPLSEREVMNLYLNAQDIWSPELLFLTTNRFKPWFACPSPVWD